MSQTEQSKILNLLDSINFKDLNHFHPNSVLELLKKFESDFPDKFQFKEMGRSRNNQPIFGVIVGDCHHNPIIAVTGNCHAEEAIGTTTILKLAESLLYTEAGREVLNQVAFISIPQANPDGTLLNWNWLQKKYPTYRDYLLYAHRDNRSEDIEHGIPLPSTEQKIRPETLAITEFYQRFSQIKYYVSLHSSNLSAFSYTGASFFLVHGDLKRQVCDFLIEYSQAIPLALNNEDNNGMGGLRFIERGFYSTFTFAEMRSKMLLGGDKERVSKFKLNTPEYVEQKCNCSVSMVSEISYFEIEKLRDLTPASNQSMSGDRAHIKTQLVKIEEENASIVHKILHEDISEAISSPTLDFYREKSKWMVGNIAGRLKDCEKLKETPVLEKDILDLKYRPLRLRAETMAMMVKLSNEIALPAELDQVNYLDEFHLTCDAIDRIVQVKPVPFANQVKGQAALILSGLLL
ncbi:MAG TPA: M14 family zinc carboxypeptidase [Allocoleopsis sp.]